MLTDKYFWFLQPSTQLNNYDRWFGYSFAGVFVAGLIFLIVVLWLKQPIYQKALRKWRNMLMNIGGLGLLWFLLRYENTPVFGKRFWVPVIVVSFLVWLFYVAKYMVLHMRNEKAEYEAEAIRNKYIPGRKK